MNYVWKAKPTTIEYDVRTYGVREVDLAVEGWCWVTNTPDDPDAIESALKFADPEGSLETHVEDIAYFEVPMAQVADRYKGLYIRGEDMKPRVPEELITEARTYLSRNEPSQRSFLLDIYQQVTHLTGEYGRRLRGGRGQIVAILSYFAGKSRELDLVAEGDAIETRLRE